MEKVLTSKMNIGIYGDSFAASPILSAKSHRFAWFNLLAKKLGGKVYNYETEQEGISYGLGASPTFYSYKKFLKFHRKHDLNIFMVSDPLKYSKLIEYKGELRPISGISTLEYLLQETDNASTKDLLNDIKTWYMVSDQEFLVIVQELILQDMERRSPNIILIPVWRDYFTPERWAKTFIEFAMWDFVGIQSIALGINGKELKPGMAVFNFEKPDTIACHMTEETSEYFSDLLFKYITTGEKVKLPHHIYQSQHWTHYYGE